ncbi:MULTISPECIES: hypothetical protein [unclassified Streptomyces]|uniref:hypothetical protein n=1 Tax=unclassified Streptomyces TaxID=2593676 RepID=UPI00093A8EEF|nr:hypothetical protein [Streptomyces sp. CB02058]OKI94017.1 hypothetical protein AMK10_16805 [Streptomyces sp. CB02058]
MHLLATERDQFESRLHSLFGDKLLPVEKSFEVIQQFKDGSFAMGHQGLMLYANGYNLRGSSTRHPNGLVYHDGNTIFGVGHFSKEGHIAKHLHIVAPKGEGRIEAVKDFISAVRDAGLARTSVYVRHLTAEDRDEFLEAGFRGIDADPWHLGAPEEDETFPNRVYHLEEIFEETADGELLLKKLEGEEHRKHRGKNRLAYRRFQNFLDRNPGTSFHISPYGYEEAEQEKAQGIVEGYFASRKERGAVVGSTPEDYYALIRQKPGGTNEKDYFSYLGLMRTSDGGEIPALFFSGERVSDRRASLYCTMTMRFPERLNGLLQDSTGFTAIPQFAWLNVFKLMWRQGIREIDAGGSEVKGLDDQKRQLGGKAEKTHWVVG